MKDCAPGHAPGSAECWWEKWMWAKGVSCTPSLSHNKRLTASGSAAALLLADAMCFLVTSHIPKCIDPLQEVVC